ARPQSTPATHGAPAARWQGASTQALRAEGLRRSALPGLVTRGGRFVPGVIPPSAALVPNPGDTGPVATRRRPRIGHPRDHDRRYAVVGVSTENPDLDTRWVEVA